jgi:hypothetical protein
LTFALALAGCCAIAAGVAFIYWPAALIVGGLFALAGAIFYERGAAE